MHNESIDICFFLLPRLIPSYPSGQLGHDSMYTRTNCCVLSVDAFWIFLFVSLHSKHFQVWTYGYVNILRIYVIICKENPCVYFLNFPQFYWLRLIDIAGWWIDWVNKLIFNLFVSMLINSWVRLYFYYRLMKDLMLHAMLSCLMNSDGINGLFRCTNIMIKNGR